MTTNPTPLFSILTITRNNLSGLQRTMESIMAQSLRDFEWIIIDGGSSDGTKEFLSTLPARWISEPDGGIYDAMNKGIDCAHGDYIIFMNAGDVFTDSDILRALAKAIAAENPDFIYGDALEGNGQYKKAYSHERIAQGMFTHHQAMIYSRSAIGTMRYNIHYKIAADYDFTVRFLSGASAHYIPCAICLFEEGGISHQNRQRGRREQYAIRRAQGLCSPWENLMVRLRQKTAARLKDYAPALYGRLRY